MTDKIILYHYESNGTYKHMVYHLNTGKHTENKVLPSHATLKGYTSTAAYTDQAGIVRYEIDYNAF